MELSSTVSLFKTVSLKTLRREYGRLFLTVIALALGVATMLAIRLANSAAVESFKSAANSVNSEVDLIIRARGSAIERSKEIPSAEFAQIEAKLVDKASLTPIKISYLKELSSQELIKVYGVDLLASEESASEFSFEFDQKKSPFVSLTEAGSIFLSQALAKKLNLSVGEAFSVLTTEGTKELRVLSIFSSPQDQQYALIDLSIAKSLFGNDDLSRLEVSFLERFVGDSPKEELIKKLLPELQAQLEQFEVLRPLETLGGRERMVDAFHFNMSALGYISILVGLLVVLTVTTLSIRQRSYEIALLKSLGASKAQLLGVFLLENAIIAAPALALGVFLGSYAADFLISASAETTAVFYLAEAAKGALKESVLNVKELLFVSVLSLGAVFVATYISSMQLQGISESDLLRSSRSKKLTGRLSLVTTIAVSLYLTGFIFTFLPPLGGLPVFGFLASVLFLLAGVFVFPLIMHGSLKAFDGVTKYLGPQAKAICLLAVSGGKAGIGLILPAASSLIVSMAMTIAVLFMIQSFRETVLLWIDGALNADIVMRPAINDLPSVGGVFSVDYMKAIENLPEVKRVEPVWRTDYRYQGLSVDLVARVFPENPQKYPFLFKRKECIEQFLRGEAVFVSETFSLRFSKSISQSITLRDRELRICAIYYDYAGVRGEIYLSSKGYQSLFGKELKQFSTAAIFLQGEQSNEEVRQKIASLSPEPAGVYSVDSKWLHAEVLRIFDKTFVITYAVLTLSLVIAALGVFVALVILGIEQQSSLVILQTLGGTRSEVAKALLIQTLILATCSFIPAMVSGLLIGYVLAEVINPQSFFWTISLDVNVIEIAEVFLVFVFAALLSAVIPILMALKTKLSGVSRDA